MIDGAHVTGKVTPDGQAVEAICELIEVAGARFGDSDTFVASPHRVTSVNGEEVFHYSRTKARKLAYRRRGNRRGKRIATWLARTAGPAPALIKLVAVQRLQG